MTYAHSLSDQPVSAWEPLSAHLSNVSERAAEFASVFGFGEAARVAGLLHDIGKCSMEYQNYIRQAADRTSQAKGPDHSTAGAKEALKAYPGVLGRMLAFAIAGHHAGLPDFERLDRRVARDVPVYS